MNSRNLPLPSALLSTLPMTSGLSSPVLEVAVTAVPAPRPSKYKKSRERTKVEKYAVDKLEQALEELRAVGASEQELGNLVGAVRFACALDLLDADLNQVAFNNILSRGESPSPEQVAISVIVPELPELIHG